MRYFDRTKQGRIIARIDRDVETLEHTFSWGPVAFVNMAACLLFAFARIVWAHPYLTPFVLAAVPVLWGLTRLFERVGFPAYRRVRETHSAISAHVAERITGVRIVKGFAAEDREVEGLNVLQARYRQAVMGGARATAGFIPGLSLAIQALVVVAVAFSKAWDSRSRIVLYLTPIGALAVGVLAFSVLTWVLCQVAGAAVHSLAVVVDTLFLYAMVSAFTPILYVLALLNGLAVRKLVRRAA